MKMNFRKKIIWFVGSALVVNSLFLGVATADQGEQNLEVTAVTEKQEGAGIGADSPLYFLDRFMEKLQLMLAFSNQAKTELELKLASERLSEAEKLVAKEKIDRLERVVEDHSRLIERAQDRMTQLLEDDNDLEMVQEIKDRLEKMTAKDAAVLNKVLDKLNRHGRGEAAEKIAELLARRDCLNLAVDLSTELAKGEDEEKDDNSSGRLESHQELITELRTEHNYGYGEIAILLSLAERMTAEQKPDQNEAEVKEDAALKAVAELMEKRKQGMGWGQIAKQAGLHPGKKADKIVNSVRPEQKDEIKVDANQKAKQKKNKGKKVKLKLKESKKKCR
jgi:hypothetical protein